MILSHRALLRETAWQACAVRLVRTRQTSRWIAEPLTEEDQIVQAMEDASPTKWHLAHTTWFFEEMVLKPLDPAYRVFDERFGYCFNSYYETVGARQPRPKRSLLTRPRHDEVMAYRAHVDRGAADVFRSRRQRALARGAGR